MCVCVGVDADGYVYGSVLKKGVTGKVVMHLNYLFLIHHCINSYREA